MISTANGDNELFAREMADVIPLQSEKIIPRTLASHLSTEALRERQRAAQTDDKHDPNFLTTTVPEHFVDPYGEIKFRRPGLQNGVFKALRQGHYECPYVLDLHNRTVEQARNDIFYFIADALERQLRCVLVLHGRGVNAAQPALLKTYVSLWLPQLPAVMAMHSAHKKDGGSGAVYVLLKKTDEAKQENRERFGQR